MEKITLDRDLRAIFGRNCFDVLFELVEMHNYLIKHKEGYDGTFEYPIEQLSETTQIGETVIKETISTLYYNHYIDIMDQRKTNGSNKSRYRINPGTIKETEKQISKKTFTYHYGYKAKGKERPTRTQTIRQIRQTVRNNNEL